MLVANKNEVGVADKISPEKFRHKDLHLQKPLVIKGSAKDTYGVEYLSIPSIT